MRFFSLMISALVLVQLAPASMLRVEPKPIIQPEPVRAEAEWSNPNGPFSSRLSTGAGAGLVLPPEVDQFSSTAVAAAIPEPESSLLFLVGACVLFLTRNRARSSKNRQTLTYP